MATAQEQLDEINTLISDIATNGQVIEMRGRKIDRGPAASYFKERARLESTIAAGSNTFTVGVIGKPT